MSKVRFGRKILTDTEQSVTYLCTALHEPSGTMITWREEGHDKHEEMKGKAVDALKIMVVRKEDKG